MVDQWSESERKLDVLDDFVLPAMQALLPDGGSLESAVHLLDNTYWDTPSLRLVELGVTLRRREGGPDAGWHLKVPDHDARVEIIDTSRSPALPESLANLVVGVAAGEEIAPVAQLAVERTAHQLVTGEGVVLVEVADDRVQAMTMGSEARLSHWRELEVELKSDAGVRMQGRVMKRLRAAGAQPSASGSKLRRALGLPPDPREAPDLGTIGGLAWAYVAEQCQEMVRCDIRLRLDEPLIHKFRVAIRRLRSTLRVFAPLFEPDESADLERELVWLAGLLGQVRDREVLLARLAAQVAALPAELVLGPVAAHIETTLLLERSQHLARLDEAMKSHRYQRLMRLLLRWRTQPPLTARGNKSVTKAERYLRRAETKVTRRLREAGGDVEALHDARKAAKRYRYAAELSAQVGGKRAARIVKSTTKLQTLLGEHQDSVVSAAFLRRLGAQAGADGNQNGFTYGYLAALESERASRIRDEAARRWGGRVNEVRARSSLGDAADSRVE